VSTCTETLDAPALPWARAIAERLALSPMGGQLPGEINVDLFAGGGGATCGVEDAGLVVHECVNHSAVAIATHAANHPATNHRQGDVWGNAPAAVAAGRPVGLLWASPDCRHFSRARGAAPVSGRVRSLAWVVVKWAQELPEPQRPRIIIVENVAEFLTWGPTRAKVGADGRPARDPQGRVLVEPVPGREGETFKRWVRALKRAGYTVEWRVFDAADFGAACRRKRLFVIARRDGLPIGWPEVVDAQSLGRTERRTEAGRVVSARSDREGIQAVGMRDAASLPRGVHAGLAGSERGAGEWAERTTGRHRASGQSAYGRPARCAADVIDWSDLGTSIFGRPKPLADKTLARIAEGIRRHVIDTAEPFILRLTHGEGWGAKVAGVDGPLPTQTTRQDLALCVPVVQAFRGNAQPCAVGVPMPTITAGNGPGRGAGAGHALGMYSAVCAPFVATVGYGEREGQRPRVQAVGELLGTLVGAGKHALVAPVLMHNTTHHTGGPVTGPLPTITTGGQTALVAPVLTTLRAHTGPTRADEPLRTITSGGTHAGLVAALLVKFYGTAKGGQDLREPLGTVTTVDRHGLVVVRLDGQEFVIVDILFRMLKPRELAAAMGFPDGYVWPKTQREAVRLIGNAVSPPMARALVAANLPRGRGERRATA
jgi:DNA (cytosine-5)-methyltransferase 1